MRYDVILFADNSVGYGRMMRALALAEAVALAGKQALVFLDNEPPGWLRWPCPVIVGWIEPGRLDTELLIVDTDRADYMSAAKIVHHDVHLQRWRIVDSPDEAFNADLAGYIYPHFGASPIAGRPTLFGEQFMPLRHEFGVAYELSVTHPDKRVRLGTLSYRHADTSYHPTPNGLLTADYLSRWEKLVCPPSTIAYEAMCVGTPVFLHDGLPQYAHIKDAMIDAGAALDANAINFKRATTSKVDGRGARRLVDILCGR